MIDAQVLTKANPSNSLLTSVGKSFLYIKQDHVMQYCY